MKYIFKANHARVSKKTTYAVFVTAVAIVVGMPIGVLAADLQQQQQNLNQKIEQNKENLERTGKKINTLSGQISALEDSIKGLESKISKNQSKIVSTVQQIDVSKQKLEKRKQVLSESMRQMYFENDASVLEMVASSNNLSDFLDKQEYRNSVQGEIKNALDEIEELKKQLEDKKAALEKQQNELAADKRAVESQRSKKSELLATTKGKEANYQKQLEKAQAAKNRVDAEIAELARQLAAQAAQNASSNGNYTNGVNAGLGTPVKRGQQIGLVGSSGASTGPHVHFRVLNSNGVAVNPQPLINSGTLQNPTPGATLTQGFGPSISSYAWLEPFHDALDLASPFNTPIYAAADGVIVKDTFMPGGYGNYIVIRHNNGMLSFYTHMM